MGDNGKRLTMRMQDIKKSAHTIWEYLAHPSTATPIPEINRKVWFLIALFLLGGGVLLLRDSRIIVLALPVLGALLLGIRQWQLDHQQQLLAGVQREQAVQEKLAAGERRYHALFEQTHDAIFIMDMQGIHREVNQRAAELLGCSVHQLLGNSFLDYVVEPERQQQIITTLRKQGSFPTYEQTMRRANGYVFPAEISVSLVRDNSGEPLYIQSVIRDVTRRKAVQEELKMLQRIDKELGYTLDIQHVVRMALDAAIRRTEAVVCVIGWIDDDTRQLRRVAYLGETRFLTEPVNLRELYKPDSELDVSRVFQENTPLLSTRLDNHHAQLILPLITHSDTRGVMLLEAADASAFDESNRHYLLYLARRTATALDNISVHMKTQQHAEQMDVLYKFGHTLAATLARPDVQNTLTRGLGILLKASCTFFCEYDRHSRKTTLNSTYIQPQAKDDLSVLQHFAHYDELIEQVAVDMVQFRQSGANSIPAADQLMQAMGVQTLLLLPLRHEKHLLGFVGVGESHYERFFSRDELALALNLTSQALIAVQRASLINHLQESEQIKSEMIRMASHDLRNPLAQIKGNLELLESNLDSAVLVPEYLGGMERGIAKMERLLVDILNLERAESQKSDTWQALSILPMLHEIAYSFRDQVHFKAQVLEVQLPTNIPPIIGSDIQLQQTFTNLIDNAIKYTPEQGKISVEARVEDGRFIFSVRDTGYGIPKDRQERLFQRFYRAQTPGTETISGTGLGLSLVKTVVQRHGGEVFFESEEGVGSTFGCWFPLVLTEQPSSVAR